MFREREQKDNWVNCSFKTPVELKFWHLTHTQNEHFRLCSVCLHLKMLKVKINDCDGVRERPQLLSGGS